MTVLIGGGSGFVGRHLQALLRSKGYKFKLISRTPRKEAITWTDLARNGLPDDVLAVVNLSGENLMNPKKRWNDSFKAELWSSRVDTTSQLATAIAQSKQKPKVWVSTSAVGYYQASPTAVYTEESAGGTGSFLAELCSQCEKAAILPESCRSDVRHVTVRIGIVLGRDGGAIQQMYLPFFLGVGGRIASGQQWFPWVHVDDVAGIYCHAIENGDVTGVLNAVAPQPTTNSQFTAAFARAMWRPALFPVPAAALRLVYGAERAEVMTEGPQVVPKRTLDSGYKFLYPNLDLACREFARMFNLSELQ